jgi:hypothetical protein
MVPPLQRHLKHSTERVSNAPQRHHESLFAFRSGALELPIVHAVNQSFYEGLAFLDDHGHRWVFQRAEQRWKRG